MGPDIVQDFSAAQDAPTEGIELYAPEYDTPVSVLQPLVDLSDHCEMEDDMASPGVYE